MPPYLFFWDDIKVVAVVVIWADNSFLATFPEWVERWELAIQKELDPMASNVHIKSGSYKKEIGAVTFLGVEWSWASGELCIRLPADKIVKWRVKLQEGIVRQHIPLRQAASLAGTIFWLWSVEGGRLGSIRAAVVLSSYIASIALKNGWNTIYIDQGNVLVEACALLKEMLQMGEAWHKRPVKSEPALRASLFLCSDANAARLGGVRLLDHLGDEDGSSNLNPVRVLVDEGVDSCLHINIKETIAGLRTLKEGLLIARAEGSRSILLGMDNKTATKALSVGFYPGQEELSRQIWSLLGEIEAFEISFRPCYVPGIFQPADEVTRGKPIVGESFMRKVQVCRGIMEQFVRSSTKDTSRLAFLGKRVREEEGN